MPHPTALRACAVAVALQVGSTAFAAHPLQTEDTGTQGTGNIEIENGLSWTRAGATSVFMYQPQVSFGATPALDLIAQPAWLDSRVSGDGSTRGLGDTNLDAKWRFFGEAPWSLAVRGGITLATSQHDLGLQHGKTGTHVLLTTTVDAAPITAHGNIGFVHSPVPGSRADTAFASTAVMWARSEQVILTGEASIGTSADSNSSSIQGSVLVGAIYTAQPGLDLDIGYRSTLHTAPTGRAWLLGVTYRFAP